MNKKVLKLNGILNEVFKIAVLVIAKDLIKVVNYCFTNRIILKSLKKFIIIVLRKKRKKDYFLPSSYRLIAFKNTLVKILEKHIVNIILKVIKKF